MERYVLRIDELERLRQRMVEVEREVANGDEEVVYRLAEDVVAARDRVQRIERRRLERRGEVELAAEGSVRQGDGGRRRLRQCQRAARLRRALQRRETARRGRGLR